MKAYRSKRSVVLAGLHLTNPRRAFYVWVLFGSLLTACQSGRVTRDTITIQEPKSTLVKKAEEPSTRRLDLGKATPVAVVSRPESMLPPAAENLTSQVSRRLGTSFHVSVASNEALVIRKSSLRSAKPALFEEAIILAKLRTFLKSSAMDAMPSSVTFQNGTAAVNLPPAINSGTASVLIAKMLSLDGVDEVRAGFDGQGR